MVHRGQYARFAFEARLPVQIGEPDVGQDFECDVAGPIDTPHAAGAEKSGSRTTRGVRQRAASDPGDRARL
jgi:hypothetical protein